MGLGRGNYVLIPLESKYNCEGYMDCIPTLPDAKQCATGFAPTYLILSWFHTVGHSLLHGLIYEPSSTLSTQQNPPSKTIKLFQTFHQTVVASFEDGKSWKADEAQVSHKEMAVIPQAHPHRQLHSRRERIRRGLERASRRLCGEVPAAIPRKV